MKATATILTIAAVSLTASASVTSYTETFESGSNNWVSGAFTPTTWNATGSIDNSAYISSQLDLNTAGPFGITLLRGQDDQDASGDAFVGNYLTGGITTVEFDFRHNAGVDLDIALRVASSANFPAFAVESSSSTVSGEWTHLTFDLFFGNPLLTIEGAPTPAAFNAVMEAVGNLQVSAFRPDGLDTELIADFDLDNVAIVPAPSGLALLGLGCLGVSRRRRA